MSANRRDHGHSNSSSSVPKLYSVFQGEVASVQEYGAFVKIPSHHKNGLIHRSQISSTKVEDAKDVLSVGEKVFCKVISLGEDNDKIALSMKVVNQDTGKDQDPNNLSTMQDEQRRKSGGNYVKPKIELGAIFNTTCRQCGGQGHLATNCFQVPGSKTYDILPDLDTQPPPPEVKVPHHKKKKKEKVKKKRKCSKNANDTNSSSDEKADDEPKKKQQKHKKKKSKSSHRQSHSSSDDDSSSSEDECRRKKHLKQKSHHDATSSERHHQHRHQHKHK